MRKQIETRKYVLAFVITAIVFGGALMVSNRFAQKRLEEIKTVESNISLNILSSETQFALLKERSCKAIDHSTAFSEELNSLSQKLSFMEENLGNDNAEVMSLKKYYSLLQVKDYLLVKQVNEKCGVKPTTIIYFYSNKGECTDCKNEEYALAKLRDEFPELRIYSFDYNLDISVVKTMRSIYDVRDSMPALIIADEPYYGYKDVAAIEKLIPELKKLRAQHEKILQQKTTRASSTQP